MNPKNINKPLVSVIVPVYNAEQFLGECVQSVINQTYTNWELLLVDDGSPDMSGSLCDKWSEKDNRIRVFHKANGGASSARNKGLKEAEGEWITFVDADDVIHRKFLENRINCDTSDYVVGGFSIFGKARKNTLKRHSYKNDEYVDYLRNIALSRASGCSSLYKKSIINSANLCLNEKLRSGEDHLFNLEYLLYCRSVEAINDAGYYIRPHELPIENRYNMHSNDLLYLINSLTSAYKALEKKFGFKDNTNYRALITRLSHYRLEDFADKGERDYYNLYYHYYPDASREDFFHDGRLNPIRLFLTSIIQCNNSKFYDQRIKLENIFRKTFTHDDIDCARLRTSLDHILAKSILDSKKIQLRILYLLYKAIYLCI